MAAEDDRQHSARDTHDARDARASSTTAKALATLALIISIIALIISIIAWSKAKHAQDNAQRAINTVRSR